MKRKGTLKIVFYSLAILSIIIVVVRYMTRAVKDIESAGVKANQLITSAGGPAIVCGEANQMFNHFGVSKVKFFSPSDLKDYPAIAALGKVDGIWPGSPPYIKIRVGTRLSGFFIAIVNTNSSIKYPKPANSLEIVDSCVFVHSR